MKCIFKTKGIKTLTTRTGVQWQCAGFWAYTFRKSNKTPSIELCYIMQYVVSIIQQKNHHHKNSHFTYTVNIKSHFPIKILVIKNMFNSQTCQITLIKCPNIIYPNSHVHISSPGKCTHTGITTGKRLVGVTVDSPDLSFYRF